MDTIVAQHGGLRFLVQVDDNIYRVLDLEHRRYWSPRDLDDVVGIESWDPPSTDRTLDELLDDVEVA